jgi:hypothetical protein
MNLHEVHKWFGTINLMRNLMKTVLYATAVFAFLATPVLASSPCDADLKAVDAALISAKLDPVSLKKVQDLRAQGGKAATENKAGDCLKTIAEAKKMLGVK